MSWVKYDKNAIITPELKRFKKMCVSFIKEHTEYGDAFFFSITGKSNLDYDQVKYYETKLYNELVKDVTKSLEENKECYDGFYTNRHIRILTQIQGIQKLMKFAFNCYS